MLCRLTQPRFRKCFLQLQRRPGIQVFGISDCSLFTQYPPSWATRRRSYLASHPEKTKPPVPYAKGVVLHGRSHTPSEPLHKGQKMASGRFKEQMKNRHPLDICLENLPTGGVLGNETISVRMLRQISVDDGANAQVVLIELLPQEPGSIPAGALTVRTKRELPLPQPPEAMVAKFYDPLYCDFQSSFDIITNSETGYSLEVKAYKWLKPLQGTVIPRFYGSHTFDIPIYTTNELDDVDPRRRFVRVILYEYVPGFSLPEMRHCKNKPGPLSQQQRKAVMTAILDGESKMYQLDVLHRDLEPRNVIVNPAKDGVHVDVRIIDFSASECGYRAKKKGGPPPTLDPEPVENIIERWWDENMDDMMLDFSWFVDWPWNEWLQNEYAGGKKSALGK